MMLLQQYTTIVFLLLHGCAYHHCSLYQPAPTSSDLTWPVNCGLWLTA